MILHSITRFVAEEDVTQTHHAILPEGYELLFGIPASLLVFGLLFKFAGPAIKTYSERLTSLVVEARCLAAADAGQPLPDSCPAGPA